MPGKNGGGSNPWGNGSQSGPPDLGDLVQKFGGKFKQSLPKGGLQGIIFD